MGTSIKYVIALILALAIGLGAGYFFFGRNGDGSDTTLQMEGHDHSDESEVQIWTCSMHPQIRQNEPGLCPICEMELIPLSSAASTDPMRLEMTEEAVKLAQVGTMIVGKEQHRANNIALSGKIYPDETLTSSVVAHVPGRIEKLYVRFTGEQVAKGQLIAEIYSPQMITAQRELIEAAQLSLEDSTLVNAARQKLRFWRASEEFISTVENEGKIIERVGLYAEESGIVDKRNVAIGDYVDKGEVLFGLVSLDRVWAEFDAYEEDLKFIDVGDQISFETRAIPGKKFSSRVSFIDPLIDPRTRTASVRAEINNSNGALKPEMFIQGVVRGANTDKSVLLVPRSAVLWTGKRSVIYEQDTTAEIPTYLFREVVLGSAVGDQYVILEGLSAGARIVVEGTFVIDAAAQLNNQSSMINRNVGIKDAETQDHIIDYSGQTPQAFKEQLRAVADDYLSIKDALVATDHAMAASKAAALAVTLKEVDMTLVEGKAHHSWMRQQQGIELHAGKIAGSSDIQEQRHQFEYLTTSMISALRTFGLSGNNLYIQHCPMAFDNDGADWISAEQEVQNPYFGEKMMKCGLVTDTLGPE